MTTRIVETEAHRKSLANLIAARKLPFTVEIVDGRRRSLAQNRTQRLWCNEIAEQLGGHTAEDIRADAKLRFGVPIMRAENEAFREKYDRLIKPLPYETKIELMSEPMDFPVTRLMTTKQKAAYLDAMQRHYLALGVALTDPGSSA